MADAEQARMRFEIWKEYEAVAMHFNDLLIKLRTQALAGLIAVSTIAATVLKPLESHTGVEPQWMAMSIVLGMLFVLWLAVNILDFGYYNRLLNGAVAAIEELEGETLPTPVRQLNLSTRIEQAVSKKQSNRGNQWRWTSGRYWFYSLVGGLLLASAGLSVAKSAGWYNAHSVIVGIAVFVVVQLAYRLVPSFGSWAWKHITDSSVPE